MRQFHVKQRLASLLVLAVLAAGLVVPSSADGAVPGREIVPGKVYMTNSSGQDEPFLVENTALTADPYRFCDGTDRYLIYGFDLSQLEIQGVRATVLMNYVVSVSANGQDWTQVANWGDLSNGERIQSQDNVTDVDVIFSDYGISGTGYLKISNMDNEGDYGGAIQKLTLLTVTLSQLVDLSGRVADPIMEFDASALSNLADNTGVSGYPDEIAGVRHALSGSLYDGLTTEPAKPVRYDFELGESYPTNSDGADAEFIEEDAAIAAAPYRYCDGTDRYIIYRFDLSNQPDLAVRATVLMNYVVSVSSNRTDWIEVANWGDLSNGERIQSQFNVTDIDVVFQQYGITDTGYLKISNMDNQGDYGGAIQTLTLMTATAQEEDWFSPGDKVALEIDCQWELSDDQNDVMNLSVLNGAFGVDGYAVDRQSYLAEDIRTSTVFTQNYEYRTISLEFTLPTSEQDPGIAQALHSEGFRIHVEGLSKGVVYHIRLYNQTTGELAAEWDANSLICAAREATNPSEVRFTRKSWSATEQVIAIEDGSGPHLGTVFGQLIPPTSVNGTPYYSEGDVILIYEHVWYDCDQDSLPKTGDGPRTVVRNPNVYVEFTDSDRVDMAEYLGSEVLTDDRYGGEPYREILYSFTVPSREEGELLDQGFRFDQGSFLSYPDYPIRLYYVGFFNTSTGETFFEMDGNSLCYTPCQNTRRITLTDPDTAGSVQAVRVAGNQPSVLLNGGHTTLSAGVYAYDFNYRAVGSGRAATVSVLNQNNEELASSVISQETQLYSKYRLAFELEQETTVHFEVKYHNEVNSFALENVTLNRMLTQSQAQVKQTVDAIEQLPGLDELTLDDAAAVNSAKMRFDRLSDEQKAEVTNREKLMKAVEKIEELEKLAEENAAAAKAVDDAIHALPAVKDLAKADQSKVEAARAAYAALNDRQKPMVTALGVLEAAEARMALLTAASDEDIAAAKAVDDKIFGLPALGELTADDKGAVEEARAAYDALTQQQAKLVIGLTVLEEAEKKIAGLAPDVMFGDIDGNTKIDASDALLALQHSVKLKTLEGSAFLAADVDGNEKIDASDALLILQYSVKLIDHFPVEE